MHRFSWSGPDLFADTRVEPSGGSQSSATFSYSEVAGAGTVDCYADMTKADCVERIEIIREVAVLARPCHLSEQISIRTFFKRSAELRIVKPRVVAHYREIHVFELDRRSTGTSC